MGYIDYYKKGIAQKKVGHNITKLYIISSSILGAIFILIIFIFDTLFGITISNNDTFCFIFYFILVLTAILTGLKLVRIYEKDRKYEEKKLADTDPQTLRKEELREIFKE